MAIQILKAAKRGNTYRIVIWLDDTKLKNGLPDPAWTETYHYGDDMPKERIKQELNRITQIRATELRNNDWVDETGTF